MRTVAHIINPFIADESSDLFVAQPITFQSMINAKKIAANEIKVELLSAQFAEDTNYIPIVFTKTTDLSRSVLDGNVFSRNLKLPFLIDILERAYNESAAEYLIYSNVDIGLYPNFYLKVNEFIEEGFDSFIINRRRLKRKYSKVSDLNEIYKDSGRSHPGFDCFVLHRSLVPKLKLEGICIGVPFVEIAFSQNLFALSKNFKLFEEETQTFHIGEEIFYKRAPNDYYKYNQEKFWKLVPQLIESMEIKKIPYSHYFLPLRFLKWAFHPCIPIRLILKLEFKRLF